MKYRHVGKSGLMVSELSLGSWLTYGNTVDDTTAIDTIDAAYECGINSFDTANGYNLGQAEKSLARRFGNIRAAHWWWLLKFSFPWGMGRMTADFPASI